MCHINDTNNIIMKDFDFNDLKKNHNMDAVLDEILSEEFTLKNLSKYGVTARHLQYWQEKGIMPNKNRKTDEIHRFNFVEFIWIEIVCELSLFRFPIAKIKKVKEFLFAEKSLIEYLGYKKGDDLHEVLYKLLPQLKTLNKRFEDEKILALFSSISKYKKLPFLSLFISNYILERMNSKIIIYSNGDTEIMPLDNSIELMAYLKEIEDKSYLSIPLSKLMSQFINNSNNNEFTLKYHLLNDYELQILSLVQLNKFDSIKILFKNGEPFILEATENIKVSKDARISDILLKKGYQSIEIKTEEGQIQYSPKTTKIVLK